MTYLSIKFLWNKVILTVFSNRSLLIRRYHLTQLVNVVEIRIMLIIRHRLILKFIHFPIVFWDNVVWIIFLMHMLLSLILMMRVTIHDAELLIFTENITNAEWSRHRRGQHSKAFFDFWSKVTRVASNVTSSEKILDAYFFLSESHLFHSTNQNTAIEVSLSLCRAWRFATPLRFNCVMGNRFLTIIFLNINLINIQHISLFVEILIISLIITWL